MKVLVLGVRGNIGRHVAHRLEDNPEIELNLTSHSDAGVSELAAAYPGAQPVKVDINDTKAMARAIEGMQKIVVISPNFIDENIATGNLVSALSGSEAIQQIIRVTGLIPGQGEETIPQWMRGINATCWQHLVATRLLDESGLPVTYVNPTARFMQNYLSYIGTGIRERRLVVYPHPFIMPHIDTRDIAEVLAQLIMDDAGTHIGREYKITGAKEDVLNCAAVADLFTSVLGFQVRHSEDIGYFNELMGEGASILVDYLKWHKDTVGDLHFSTDNVRLMLGKEPRKFRDWIRENADFFSR